MLFTPEMSGLLDRDRERAGRASAKRSGRSGAGRGARGGGARPASGSISARWPCSRSDGGKLVNRGFVIDDEGEIRARYDKIHLFDVDLPTGESWRESAAYRGGDRAVRGRYAGRRARPFDLLRSALRRSLFGAQQCRRDHACRIPAAFTVPTGEAHWHVLMRARAIEAGAFVVAAAQVGTHEDGRATYGHSLVVDPWGKVLLDMGGEAPGLGFAEIDPDAVEEVRGAAAGDLASPPDPAAGACPALIIFDLKCVAARPCFRSLVRIERGL